MYVCVHFIFAIYRQCIYICRVTLEGCLANDCDCLLPFDWEIREASILESCWMELNFTYNWAKDCNQQYVSTSPRATAFLTTLDAQVANRNRSPHLAQEKRAQNIRPKIPPKSVLKSVLSSQMRRPLQGPECTKCRDDSAIAIAIFWRRCHCQSVKKLQRLFSGMKSLFSRPENLAILPFDRKSLAIATLFANFEEKSPLEFGWQWARLRQKIAAICDCDFWCCQAGTLDASERATPGGPGFVRLLVAAPGYHSVRFHACRVSAKIRASCLQCCKVLCDGLCFVLSRVPV